MEKKYSLPSASIIIPTYNRSRLLKLTLDSIVNQAIDKKQFEVIVADDGSKDNTRDLVASYSNKLDISYYFLEDKGYRPGAARNVGIANAKGDIIILIDSGIILGSGCIKAHLEFHGKNLSNEAMIGYVYGFDQENANGDVLERILSVENFDESVEYFKTRKCYLDIREEIYTICSDDLSTLPAPWAFFWTCNVSLAKKVLLEVGMFDPRYDGYWGVEDLDLAYRVYLNSNNFRLNREAVSIHYPHEKDVEKRLKDEMRNKHQFHEKYNSIETKEFLTSNVFQLNYRLIAQNSELKKQPLE